MKNETVIGDIANNRIRFLVKGEELEFHEERDDYQKRELKHFLGLINGTIPPEDGYHCGLDVLALTQGIIK